VFGAPWPFCVWSVDFNWSACVFWERVKVCVDKQEQKAEISSVEPTESRQASDRAKVMWWKERADRVQTESRQGDTEVSVDATRLTFVSKEKECG
jgi:hypothetical protein